MPWSTMLFSVAPSFAEGLKGFTGALSFLEAQNGIEVAQNLLMDAKGFEIMQGIETARDSLEVTVMLQRLERCGRPTRSAPRSRSLRR